MDRVKISYLAAGWVKNELITGHKVTYHTLEDLTMVTVYDKELNVTHEYQFRDVFRVHRKFGNAIE